MRVYHILGDERKISSYFHVTQRRNGTRGLIHSHSEVGDPGPFGKAPLGLTAI